MLTWREPRRRVVLPVRMRIDAAWGDAVILNASSRGMMVKSASPPPPRSYVDIRRGQHIVIGRVIWRAGDRFGVRTQDKVDIDALLGEPRRPPDPAGPSPAIERRKAPRSDAERSRLQARLLQYAAVTAAGGAAAAFAAIAAWTALAQPIAAVAEQLAGTG